LEDLQRILGNILRTLRSNPQGLSVSDVSRYIGLNRNSAAKYLDILLYTGRVEVRKVGRAKLFYITQRIPISAMLDFSSDLILGLDDELRIIDANDNFQRFFHVKKEMLLDREIGSIDLPIFTRKMELDLLREALNGRDSSIDMEVPLGEEMKYFRGKLIPTILADGKKGATVLLENISDRRAAQKMVDESEEKFRSIYQAARDAMIISGPEGLFECNQATKNMFGCQDKDFMAKKLHFFSPPTQPNGDDSQKLMEEYSRKALSEGSARFEWMHRRFDGSDFKTDIILTPIEFHSKKALLAIIRDMSEREFMEAALRENEEKYRVLFESSPDAVILIDEGGIFQCNESSKTIFGVDSVEELIGKHPADISPPFQPDGKVSRTKANRLLKEAFNGRKMKFDWEHMRKDGSVFHAAVILARTFLGNRPVLQGTIRDVTDIIHIQKELEEREERFQNILSSLHGAFIGLIDNEYTYQGFWGAQLLRELHGVEPEEMLGRSSLEFAPPDMRNEFKMILDEIFTIGQPKTVEVEGRFNDVDYHFLMSFSPIISGDGEVTSVVQYASDTTEKFKTFKKLKETEERYRMLEENATDVIWMADSNLNYTFISASSENITGFRPDELLGVNIMDSISPRSRNRFEKTMKRKMERLLSGEISDRPPEKLEMELIRKDGTTVWTEIGSNVLLDEEGKPEGVLGVTRDITERRDYQNELEKLVSAFKLTSEAIILTDLDGRIVDVNDSFLKQFKVKDRSLIIGVDGLSFLQDSNIPKVREDIKHMIDEGEPIMNEHTVLDMEGNELILSTSSQVLNDEFNEPIGFVITSRDITSERRAWNDLAQRERILRSISSLSEDIIKGGGSSGSIVKALGEMGEALDVSRIYIFQNSTGADGKVLTSQVKEWVNNGISPQIDNKDLQGFDMEAGGFSRWVEVLSMGDMIIGPVRDLPEKEREFLEIQDIRSILVVPITASEKWWGFMGFDDCGAEREWSIPEIEALKTAANIIGYGLNASM
jgi:PAS domain S-box-containing protein